MTVEYPDRQDILLQFIAYRIQTLPRVRFTCLNFLGMLHAFGPNGFTLRRFVTKPLCLRLKQELPTCQGDSPTS